MSIPSISVVLGTFNGERFIEEQLRSLFRQTLAPCEIIVSDDGSQDRTVEIVRALGSTSSVPVRLSVNPRNLGFGENFLAAALGARGEWVAFCDQDDIWSEHKLERCAKAFDASTVLVVHAATLLDGEGTPVGPFSQGIERDTTKPPLSYDPWSVFFGFSMVFRRSLLDAIPHERRGVDYITGRSRLAHDRWVLYLASQLGNVRELACSLVGYRQHDANVFGATRRHSFLRRVRDAPGEALLYRRAAREQRHLVEVIDEAVARTFPLFDRTASRRFWSEVERRQESRARLYEAEGRVAALGWLVRNALGGVYVAVHSHRFRPRSFARDLAFVLSAPIPSPEMRG